MFKPLCGTNISKMDKLDFCEYIFPRIIINEVIILVKVQVPASSANIGPGFDILGLALKLYNTVEMKEMDNDKLVIEYSGEGSEHIVCDESNLIYQGLKKFYDYVDQPCPGFHIKIANDIPLMGGLGSSSSAIVSGIVAANEHTSAKLSKHELLKLAVELDGHPDNVTPALFGGFTFSYQEADESADVIQLKFPGDLKIIAVTPNYHVSTHETRKEMPKKYPIKTVIKNTSNLYRLIKAFEEGELSRLATLLEDEIHQPYRFALVPGLKKAYENAYYNGAIGAYISGSGPTLAVIAKGNYELIAQGVVDEFQKEKLTAKVRVLEVDFNGAKLI